MKTFIFDEWWLRGRAIVIKLFLAQHNWYGLSDCLWTNNLMDKQLSQSLFPSYMSVSLSQTNTGRTHPHTPTPTHTHTHTQTHAHTGSLAQLHCGWNCFWSLNLVLFIILVPLFLSANSALFWPHLLTRVLKWWITLPSNQIPTASPSFWPYLTPVRYLLLRLIVSTLLLFVTFVLTHFSDLLRLYSGS